MKGLRIMLVPATVAWFVGGTWWLTSNVPHAPRATSAQPNTTASIIHLGPAREVIAGVPAYSTVATPNLVIPFAKNTGDFLLSDEQAAWCRTALERLLADPNAGVVVTGHTDADGDAEVNRRLSAARAGLVMEALVNEGLPADRIRAEGRGPDEPIADNETSKGKAMNRRVEVSLGPLIYTQNP